MSDDVKNNDDIEPIDDVFAMDESEDVLGDAVDDDWNDDIAFDADDFENETDLDDDFDIAPAKQSNINWFNIIVFGLVAMVALGIGYTTFFPSNPQSQSQLPAAQVQSIADRENLAQSALSDTDDGVSQLGLLDNPDVLKDTDNSEAVAVQENADDNVFDVFDSVPGISESEIDDIFSDIEKIQTPSESDAVDLNIPEYADILNNSVENEANNVPSLPMPSDVEVTDVLPVVDEIQPEPVISLTAEDVSIPEAQQQPQIATDTLDEVNERIDGIASRLDVMMTELESLADNINQAPVLNAPAPVVTPEISSEAVQKMEQTIARLERKVTDLSKVKARVKAPAPKKTSTIKRTSPKPKTKSVQWDLRGASVGQAFLAERGTQNLRTVNVGDTIPTVGRITSIAIENNRWVVRGTSGTVTQ
jgi:hypothetical protein